MLYIILFHDNPDSDPDIRPKYMAQHLDFLAQHASAIRAAGPLREENGDVQSGLWLVDVDDVAGAWDLVRADPFWSTGLRQKVEIKQWAQVFAEGVRCP